MDRDQVPVRFQSKIGGPSKKGIGDETFTIMSQSDPNFGSGTDPVIGIGQKLVLGLETQPQTVQKF